MNLIIYLEFLFWAEMVGSSTFLLSAVGCTWVETSVAFAADHLVTVVLLGENSQRRLDDTSPQPEHQMEGGLLLDVVVGQGPAIFQLLAGEDQTLLVWWDSFFVLDLSLDILDSVRSLNFQGDGLTREGLYKNLHYVKLLKKQLIQIESR